MPLRIARLSVVPVLSVCLIVATANPADGPLAAGKDVNCRGMLRFSVPKEWSKPDQHGGHGRMDWEITDDGGCTFRTREKNALFVELVTYDYSSRDEPPTLENSVKGLRRWNEHVEVLDGRYVFARDFSRNEPDRPNEPTTLHYNWQLVATSYPRKSRMARFSYVAVDDKATEAIVKAEAEFLEQAIRRAALKSP